MFNLASIFVLATTLQMTIPFQAHAQGIESSKSGNKIALIQYDGDAHFGDAHTNNKNLTALALKAIANGAKIIVLPEGSTWGYATANAYWCTPNDLQALLVENYLTPKFNPNPDHCFNVASIAEKFPDGPTSRHWSALAKQTGVYIIYSVHEKGEDNKFYNAAGIAKPDGTVDSYRKRVLYIHDKYFANRGDKPYILKTPFGNFGILICKDLTFPLNYEGQKPIDTGKIEEAKSLGLDAVIAPMNWDKNPPSLLTDPNATEAQKKFVATNWFKQRATETGVTIYAADNSKWDATGMYEPGKERSRNGLPSQAEGVQGISYHPLTRNSK